MVALPLLNGVVAGADAGLELAYPVNLEPVPTDNGISSGFMRSAAGAVQVATGPGVDRGAINWDGVLYRVMGTKLVKVAADYSLTEIGDVGAGGPVRMDYGFDRLAINSGTKLFYYNGTTLDQVTDADLGPVVDMLWMDGYYITSDGTSIVVTDLADPYAVNPLKYGSAEEDPDMIVALFKLRGELYVLGQYTIQVFSNVGGSGFPFAANAAATVPVGCVGPNARCAFYQTLAFVGSGREEAPGVYILDGGRASKISTRFVDDEISKVSDQTSIILEQRMSRDERRLLVHLPDKTLVYCANASRISGQLCWYVARSGIGMKKPYRPRFTTYCYNQWICGDTQSAAIGRLDETTSKQFGEEAGWKLETLLVYNGGKPGILHSVELVGLPGRAAMGEKPIAFMSTTIDGTSWSVERAASTGARGETGRRVQWRPHRRFNNYMGVRFRGASDALAGWASCEAQVQALA